MQKTVEKRLKRSEVPVDNTWNLEDLFANEKQWETELKAIEDDISKVTQFKGKLNSGAKVLLECLNAEEQLYIRVIRVSTYASLKSSEDGSDPTNQGNSSLVAAMHAKLGAALSFIETEILSLPEGTIEQYLQQETELTVFENKLSEILEQKKYVLSPEVEELLASLSEIHNAPYTIYELSKSSDMQFNSIVDGEYELPMSFALYEDRYELSPNTEVRRKSYDSFIKTLEQYKNTFAATYATEVKKQVAISRARKYSSVTEMLLHPQKVTLEMYHNQLDIIQKELAPHMQRFANLKRRELGLDKMHFCDLKAPLDPEFNPKTTFNEAAGMILEALEVMGPEYSEIMKTALTERWVDLADNIGKSTGAFCSSPYGVHPYILITWTDTMRGAFVLAHELGHAGHFYLAGRNQRFVNTRPSTYFVEAPSTMNELLLANHILSKTNDKRMKRWVISSLLGTYYHNFVTHLLEGEFQRRVYRLAEEGKPLTAKTLCEQKYEVIANFWGDAVELDEGAGLTWMRQPHYYMGLYPYTYSAGLTVSTAVSQMIQEEGQPAVDRWLEVLKAGGTLTPLELIKKAGVDMSKPDAIKKAVAYVGYLVDELEKSYL
ncbi:oligoendopeptidase F [Bacillus sp. FJAT-49736]|uniref:oligoendopeptidase F n=1 Tax=Bacillus sp. FJAT-49736 TaxID=2833582 RepID=UPI001BC8DD38|nr:oligoendopeptidase F [Bacillus sp. FJAT-49736]MBS4173105.1 oligoendopeptidase F [Bacillus sp. FJAT-49736]